MRKSAKRPWMASFLAGAAAIASASAAIFFELGTVPASAQTERVSVSAEFHAALDRHGQWQHHSRWGDVWLPANRDREWRPYTHGRWAYTDEWGWYWISADDEQDWGWVAFHYGRWVFDPDSGWVWIPRNEWGPGWVDWRRGGEHVGWAPLPPEEILVEVEERPTVWIFIRERDFIAPRVIDVVLPPREYELFIRETVVVNRTIVEERGRIAINPGIEPQYIAAAVGRPLVPVEVRPPVLAGTTGVTNAVEVRPAERQRVQVSVTEKRQASIRPAQNIPPPTALRPGEKGRLGDHPPSAARQAEQPRTGAPGTAQQPQPPGAPTQTRREQPGAPGQAERGQPPAGPSETRRPGTPTQIERGGGSRKPTTAEQPSEPGTAAPRGPTARGPQERGRAAREGSPGRGKPTAQEPQSRPTPSARQERRPGGAEERRSSAERKGREAPSQVDRESPTYRGPATSRPEQRTGGEPREHAARSQERRGAQPQARQERGAVQERGARSAEHGGPGASQQNASRGPSAAQRGGTSREQGRATNAQASRPSAQNRPSERGRPPEGREAGPKEPR